MKYATEKEIKEIENRKAVIKYIESDWDITDSEFLELINR